MTTGVAQLPDRFMWGASSSAFQSEGHTTASNWNHYIARDGKDPYRDSVDFYDRYASDIRLAARLGVKTYRISRVGLAVGKKRREEHVRTCLGDRADVGIKHSYPTSSYAAVDTEGEGMVFTLDTTTPFGERAKRRLREERVAWLTTTSEDVTPQPVPVWFLWDGPDSFLIYSKPGTAKLRNIAARPRVSLNLDGNGEGGDVVVVLGSAAVTDDPPADALPRYVEKYAAFIARNGWTPESFAAEYSVPLRITATRLRGF